MPRVRPQKNPLHPSPSGPPKPPRLLRSSTEPSNPPPERFPDRLRRWQKRGFRQSSFNSVYGLFLLPVLWVLGQTFFGVFTHATLHEDLWLEEEFWFFSLGSLLWLIAFISGMYATGRPPLIHFYVFGHELTHAVWVWVCRGKIHEDRQMWSASGGYIITNTHNFWIALAPYFYPIYSLAVIVLYFLASCFLNLTESTATFIWTTPNQWLFLLLGFTWFFNFSFTLWMIPKGQTDLSTYGNFFSLVIIGLMNLLLLSLALIVVSPTIDFPTFAHALLSHTEDFSEFSWNLLRSASSSLFP
jgi:hypothetical protein